MTVISSAVVLSLTTSYDADNPLIGYQQLVTSTNVSATTAVDGHPASNLANPSTNLYWQGASASPLTEEYITIQLYTTDDIDYVAIARHNFGTAQVIVSLETAVDGSPEWLEIVPEFIPADDSAILMRFDPQLATIVRVRIQPGLEAPRAAVVYVGKLLILQRQIYVGHTPITMGRTTRIVNGRSESGDYLGRIVLSDALATQVDLQNMTPAWFRDNMLPFLEAAVSVPFFFAWRFNTYPGEVGYVWLTDDPKPVNQRPNGMMQVQLSMEGVS